VVKTVTFSTDKKIELIDVTGKVSKVLSDSKIDNGLCHLFTPHATAALLINENEEGLKQDFVSSLEKFFPKSANWRHNFEQNAPAHQGSSFLGQSLTIPIEAGDLILGTWQRIFFVELDGPRAQRKVVVNLLSA